MKVKGTVSEVYKNQTARILIKRASACGGNCHNCLNTCGSESEIFARFSGELKKDDSVVINTQSNRVLLLSLAVFIAPLLAIVLLYKFVFGFTANDTVSAVIAFFGGAAVFLIFVLIFRRLKMPTCEKLEKSEPKRED